MANPIPAVRATPFDKLSPAGKERRKGEKRKKGARSNETLWRRLSDLFPPFLFPQPTAQLLLPSYKKGGTLRGRKGERQKPKRGGERGE